MHIPDGFLSTPLSASTSAISLAALTYSLISLKKEVKKDKSITPLLAMLTAFVFAAQMLNFPIGGGTSGHFLGAAAIMALLGPWSACVALSLVLIVQAFLFGDGGITALGANIFNMGIVAGIVCWPMMCSIRNILPAGRSGYLASVAVTSWFSIVLASFSCSLLLAFSGTIDLGTVLPAMVGTHALIGIGEALISTAVVAAVLSIRPDIAPQWSQTPTTTKSIRPAPSLSMSGLAVAVLLATFASPFASSFPDGLERVAEDKGFIERASEEVTVWQNSLFPDYTLPVIQAEGLSTGAAGLIGTLLMFAMGYVVVGSMVRQPMKK